MHKYTKWFATAIVLIGLIVCANMVQSGATETSDPPSQELQLLPWALNRFFDLMNGNPSQANLARARLQEDLGGRTVAILFGLKPASSPDAVELSIPKNLAGLKTGEFNILFPPKTFTGLGIDKLNFDTAGLVLTGKTFLYWLDRDAEQREIAYSLFVVRKDSGGTNATSVVYIHIVDAAWRQASPTDLSTPAESELEAVGVQAYWNEVESVNTIEAYENFLELYPKGKLADQARLRLEALYFKKTKDTFTIKAYEEFLGKYPDHVEAHYLLGAKYENNGYEIDEKGELKNFDLFSLKKAINEYERVLLLNPSHIEASKAFQRCKARTHFFQGLIYMKGYPEEALREFRIGIEADPNNYSGLVAEMYNNIGNLYNKKNWYSKAVTEFEMALKIDPNLEALKYNLPYNRGLMYFLELNDLTKAEESFRSAINAEPNRSKPHTALGVLYVQQGLHTESIAELKRAIEIDPDDELAEQTLASVHKESNNKGVEYAIQGEFEKAKKEFERALEVHKSFVPAKQSLKIIMDVIEQKIKRETAIYLFEGVSFDSKGQYDQAINDYTKAIEIDPGYADTYTSRGIAYYGKGQGDQAINDFSKAIEIEPGFVNAYYFRGLAYYGKGQDDQAINDFTEAIEINAGYADVYHYRGRAYNKKGQDDEAINDFTKAIDIDPGYAHAYFFRGLTYHSLGQNDKAILDYNRTIEIDPVYADAYIVRGFLYAMNLDTLINACDDWKRACELGKCESYEKGKQDSLCANIVETPPL